MMSVVSIKGCSDEDNASCFEKKNSFDSGCFEKKYGRRVEALLVGETSLHKEHVVRTATAFIVLSFLVPPWCPPPWCPPPFFLYFL